MFLAHVPFRFAILDSDGEPNRPGLVRAAKKALACAVAAVAFGCAAGGAQAYEPGDFLLQLLAEGFYSNASGHIANDVNYDSGDMTANPALNLTYFFTKNIAAQTVIAVPLARVDLNVAGDRSSATEQWVLPLSIIGQYHFFSDEMISPYLGGGLTYAKFWEDSSHLQGGSHLEVDDTWGGVVNFGVNVKIPDTNWVAVLDAKKWWLAPTNVHVGGNKFNNLVVDPWFFGAGIGYKFSTPALF
jgi:outer membrane protein